MNLDNNTEILNKIQTLENNQRKMMKAMEQLNSNLEKIFTEILLISRRYKYLR